MFKFADMNDNNLNSAINYKIVIEDGIINNIVLERNGSTTNGVDLQVIDENTFTKVETNNLSFMSNVDIYSTLDGHTVNEKISQPIFIKVI